MIINLNLKATEINQDTYYRRTQNEISGGSLKTFTHRIRGSHHCLTKYVGKRLGCHDGHKQTGG